MLLHITNKKLLVRSLLFLMGLITRMQDQRPIKVSLQNVQAGRGTKVKYLGGLLPYRRLMGMGSHFHDWIDYNGVTFSIALQEWRTDVL